MGDNELELVDTLNVETKIFPPTTPTKKWMGKRIQIVESKRMGRERMPWKEVIKGILPEGGLQERTKKNTHN